VVIGRVSLRAGGILLVAVAFVASGVRVMAASGRAQQNPPPPTATAADVTDQEKDNAATDNRSWLLVPVVSANPKLGTSLGAVVAYTRRFDPDSGVSLFGVDAQYTSTHSTIAGVFARASFGADHHRIVVLLGSGYIKNDYQDYLGSGQPLKTNDDLLGGVGRYLYRLTGDWFTGVQGTAVNYQLFGDAPQDDLVLETLGLRGFKSAALGVVVMHDSRDSEDMPTGGWLLNTNNFAYRESLGGSTTFDSYRADFRAFWSHGSGHVLALRQNNWFTHAAPAVAQAMVVLRGYKIGQYLAPYMSSFEMEERLSFGRRWGATLFGGVAQLYGDPGPASSNRRAYTTWGAGIHFIIKPAERLLANFEYAQGVEDNRGVYLKIGYGW